MSSVDPQEFGEMKAYVTSLKADMLNVMRVLDEIQTQLAEAKGGWRTLVWFGGAAAAGGGAVLAAFHKLSKLFG